MKYHKWSWAIAGVVFVGGCFGGLNADEYQLACEVTGTLECKGNTIHICVDGAWRAAIPCLATSCVNGACVGECEAGKTRCLGNAVEECVAGQWKPRETCMSATCFDGACVGSCAPEAARCVDNTLQTCGELGEYSVSVSCVGQTCIAANGQCGGVCAPAQTQCNGNTVQSCDETGEFVDIETCTTGSCVDGKCSNLCIPGQRQCNGDTPELCDGNGSWIPQASCLGKPCSGGVCVGMCSSGAKQCNGNMPQLCDSMSAWQDQTPCADSTCVNGDCQGVCVVGQKRCNGNKAQTCDALGNWKDEANCSGQTCVSGTCKGVCESGKTKCDGNVPQTCDALGQWQNGTTCEAQAKVCVNGSCEPRPSCVGSTNNCGPNGNESCCVSPVLPQGTYNRGNNSASPATVDSFRLDRFEATVGRFRKFMNEYPGSIPTSGAGAHPSISGSGWNNAWNGQMESSRLNLENSILACAGSSWVTYTVDPNAGRERYPMNCISWYEAFAFCVWDGGRLPTEAEWNYAAAGGNQQRQYTWSDPASSTTINSSYAVYDCTADGSASQDCEFTDFLRVGSRSPKGDARWNHADIGGSLWEWVLDWDGDYPKPCLNCANTASGTEKLRRGGRWGSDASQLLTNYRGYKRPPTDRGTGTGVRCARNP